MRRGWIAVVACMGCRYVPHGAAASDGVAPDDAAVADDADADADPGLAIVTAGLIEDLDADVGTTATTWTNQATGGDDVATTAGSISREAGAVNGHAAIVFDGGTRMIGDDTAVFAPLTNGTGLTWFAVVRPEAQDNAQRNQILGTIHEGGAFSGFTAGVNTATARPYTMLRPVTTETFVQSSQNTSLRWVVLAGRLSAGTGNQTGTVYVDSAEPDDTRSVAVPGGSTCGALVIGSERTLGTEFYAGRIARILIYDRALGDLELATTGRALGARYAITTTF